MIVESNIHSSGLVESMGLIVGALSVSIAIYLQMISLKKCPKKYIVLFLGVGASLMMINLEPLIRNSTASTTEAVFYVLLGTAEIIYAYKIYSRLDKREEGLEFSFRELLRF